MDNGISGTLEAPSAYLMKSPSVQYSDDIARDMTEAFIQEMAGAQGQAEAAFEQANGHKAGAQVN